MSPEPFEAVMLDGASGWQRFRDLTLPMLRPTIAREAIFTSPPTLLFVPTLENYLEVLRSGDRIKHLA